MNLKEIISNSEYGVALIGENSKGKTYKLIELFGSLEKENVEKSTEKVSSFKEYKIEKILFLSKEIINGKIDSPKSKKFEREESKTLNTIKVKEIDIKNDTIDGVEKLSKLISRTLEEKLEYYNNIFQKNLNFELNKEDNEWKIKFQQEENLTQDLTSNGYISLIRLIVLLDSLLSNEIEWLLMDEPDIYLDVENRGKLIEIIHLLKQDKKLRFRIVFSTHNSETLFKLPEGYKIIKFIKNYKFEEYYAQDFFTKEQLEEKLFNPIREIYRVGDTMKTLISCYKTLLKGDKKSNFCSKKYCNSRECENADKFNKVRELSYKKNLSYKEGVIFKQIERLIDERV